MPRIVSARLATLAAAVALALVPSLASAQKALVYCPVGIDATGCNVIVAAIAADAARFPGGADAGFDGTQGTVDLAGADLSGYAVFVVPSLADGAGVEPYALLRNATIAGRLKAAFMGRAAVWSGTPDVGSTNRSAKDALIRNLAAWARADLAGSHGPGVVALQDNSDVAASRYSWLPALTALSVGGDSTLVVYSNVQALTQTGTEILTSGGSQIGYANMASFALQPGTGVRADATGARTTAVVLVTVAGEPSDPNIATVQTDKEDYLPPDTVVVTGAGWEPGETVSLTIHELVDPPIDPDTTLLATADATGRILNQEFVIDSADIGVRFTLTATGQTSGRVAQTTFTDDSKTVQAKTAVSPIAATISAILYSTSGTCASAGSPASLGSFNLTSAATTVASGTNTNGKSVKLTAATTSTTPAGSAFVNWTSTTGGIFNPVSGEPLSICVPGTNGNQSDIFVPVYLTTSTTGGSSANPSVFGQSVSLTATVTSLIGGTVTTGTVTFKDGAATLGTTSVNASGAAVFAVGTLAVGAHSITAVYNGSGNFTASTASAITQTVAQATTTTALASSVNPSTFGQSITLSATVAAIAPGAGTPGGTVQFKIDGANFGAPVALNAAGVATSTATSSLSVGLHPVSAVYGGSGNFTGSTSTVIATQTVGQALSTTTLTSSANPSVFGQPVTLTATVKNGATPITSGNLRFIEGGSCATPGTVLQGNQAPNAAGSVTYATSALTVAAHSVVACYDGSGAFAPSEVGLTQTVNRAATTTAISSDLPDPSTVGQPVTVNFAVAVTAPGAGTPSGNVTVSDGTDNCVATVAAGSCALTLGTAGARTLTAVYAGDATFSTSTSAGAAHTVSLIATATAVTSSLTPSTFGTAVTFTAAVTSAGNPVTAGSVTFIEGGTCAAPTTTLQAAQAVSPGGQVTFATAALGVGSHTVVACYGTSGSLAASTGTVVQTVTIAPTTLSVASATGTFAGTANLSATLTRTGDGPLAGQTVAFTLNGSAKGSATTNASGVATLAAASLAGINAGSFATGVGASFAGSATFAAATGTGALTVDPAAITVTATVIPASIAYGSVVELDADLSQNLSGRTISFSIDGTPVGTAPTNGAGKAKLLNVNPATAGIAAGSHTVTATFPAEQNFATASGTAGLTVTAAATTTAVTSSLNPSTFGQAVTFTATVTSAGGTPTGSAGFIEGGTCAAPTTTLQAAVALDGAGRVTFSSSALTAGPHTVTACFIGGTNFSASTGGVAQTVSKATPSVTWATPADITYGTALSVSQLNATASVPGTLIYTPATGTVLPAGSGQTLSVSFTPTDATNYSNVPVTTVTLNVLTLSVTPQVTVANKVYDGTTGASIATRTLTGVFGTDAVTLTGGTATFDSKQVGAARTVTVAGLALGGAAAGNYVLSSTTATTTADITARALSVTAAGQNKEYDGTTAATVTLSDDRLSGDVFTVSAPGAAFADRNVGTAKPVAVAGISTTGADAGNYTANPTATTSADITARALTVTADAGTKVYGAVDPSLTYQLTGGALVTGDALSGALTRTAGESVAGSPYAIQQGTLTAGPDYLITFVGANFSITARTLTVTASGVTRIYDGTTAAMLSLSDDRVSGDAVTVSYANASFADKLVGTGKPISVTGISLAGTDAGNYALASATASATADITPASVTGTVTVADKVYDATAAATITGRSLTGVLGTDDVGLRGGAAAFADKQVGTAKTVAIPGLTLSGGDAGNYLLSSTTATATASITRAPVTPQVTADDRVYDGTAAATIATATLTGGLGGDAVTLAVGSAAFESKTAGTGKTVTAAGLSLTGADAGNYQLTATAATTIADVAPLAITGTITAADRLYDGTTAATIASRSLTGVIAPDVVSYTGGTATFADKAVGTGRTVTATGLILAGTDAENYTVNGTATTTAAITTRPLAVTATGQTKVYDGTAAAAVALGDDRVAGDNLSLAFAAAAFADKHVGTGKTVTVTGINVTGADAGNYTYNATTTTSADITARGLLVTATGVNKVYDATTVATVSLLDDRIAGDALTPGYASASFADKQVGTAKPVSVAGISLGGADGGNYTPNSSASTTADITSLAITGNITAGTRIYDGTAAATISTRTLNGVLAGDVVSYVGGTATYDSKTVGTGKTVTATGLSLAGADAGNYTVSATATTTADITARALTVTASGIDKVYDGNTGAAVTLSDDRVAGDVLTTAFATASFADKRVGAAKPVSVTGLSISGSDAANYTFNTAAGTTADITSRTLAVTATASDKVYDRTTAATVALADDRIAGDVFTNSSAGATFSDSQVGTGKTVTVSGITISGVDADNYALASTTTTASASITARALLVSASGVDKVYDATTAATVTLSDDRVAGDALSAAYGSAVFATKNVGTGRPVSVGEISIGGTDAGNYIANTTASTTATITQAPLAVTATGINRVYDATTAATVTLAATPIAGDAVTPNYTAAAFADKNVGTVKAVLISGINLTGADGANYLPNTTTSTTADITALGLAGAVTAGDRVYDATTAAAILTRTLTGVISGDLVSYVGGTAAFANKTIGTGKTVTATGLGLSGTDAGNYTVNASAATTASITALGITGAVTAGNKVYDATTTATIASRTLTGAIAGDVVSYVGGTATFNTKDVGAGKVVTATGLSLTGADAGNYTANVTATTTASVTAAASTTVVLGSPASLPYNDNAQSMPLAATVTSPTVPGVTEGTVVFTIRNASNATVGIATAPVSVLGGTASATYAIPVLTDVGTYTIQAAFTGANFGAGSSGTGTLTVQPASFEATTATTDADFRQTDDVDVLFKNDGKLTTLQLKNTNPGTVHYNLTYRNVTGVDINAANGATLKTIIEIPAMASCGAVTCPASSIDRTAPAWTLKGAKAIHVAPDDRTDDMAVQFSYKASGSCADESTGYSSSLTGIPASAPKCIRVTGFAIPKKHRARLDLHLEFRWKESTGWAPAPDPKLYFYAGFAFKSTSTANFPTVVPSVRTSYESAGLVAAGQRVTAAGGFVFDAVGNPAASYRVRLFNTVAEGTAPNACATANAGVVAEAQTMLDGFWFAWKKGSNQANLTAADLPSRVQYTMVVCDNGATPAAVASRTMAGRMPDKEFDQEDFRLTTLVATGP